MIEQVFVSGQLGKAVYKQNDRYFVLGNRDFHDPVECRPGDISLLFDSGAQFSVIKNVGLDNVRKILEFNTQAHRALSMTIGGLDNDLSAESRLLSVDAAEEFLQEESVRAFVRARLLARPLPDVADIDGAINYAKSAGASLTASIYEEVLESQDAIEVVLEAWKETAPQFFDSIEEGESEKVLIETGAFGEMVAALMLADSSRLNSLVVSYGIKPELIRAIPRVAHILNAMKTRLLGSIGTVAKKTYARSIDEEYRNASDIDEIEQQEESHTESSGSISNLITQFDRGRSWKPSRAHEVEEKIKNQIESISIHIRRGDLDSANEFLYDLIEFHLKHSEKEHVAMSLCSLAKIALDSHELDMAEELVEYAFSLEIEDAVIPSTQAEILRAKGHSQEALRVYEETMARFPDNAFAHTGYAEVLKEMSRFEEALSVYKETTARFPNDAVARNGYASLLVVMGKFNEANVFLSSLSEGTLTSKNHWIGYHIIAMSYLKQGDIDEAIRRLEYGWRNTQWLSQKEYFATALGVARIKKREFDKALEPLMDNVVYLDIFQKQKRLALIGHSQAALGRKSEAAAALAEIKNATNPHVINLKDAVTRRFNIGLEKTIELSEIEIAQLDKKIDDEEFYIAIAA